jgi:hypothetical protein
MVGMSTLAVNQSGAIFIRVRLKARQRHEERSIKTFAGDRRRTSGSRLRSLQRSERSFTVWCNNGKARSASPRGND